MKIAGIALLIVGVVLGVVGMLFPGPLTGIAVHPLALPFVVLGLLMTGVGAYLLVTPYFRR